METINLYIQNVQYTSSRIKLTHTWTQHCQKLKRDNLENSKKKVITTYMGFTVILTVDFSSETQVPESSGITYSKC